jgi:hypothetical protein
MLKASNTGRSAADYDRGGVNTITAGRGGIFRDERMYFYKG